MSTLLIIYLALAVISGIITYGIIRAEGYDDPVLNTANVLFGALSLGIFTFSEILNDMIDYKGIKFFGKVYFKLGWREAAAKRNGTSIIRRKNMKYKLGKVYQQGDVIFQKIEGLKFDSEDEEKKFEQQRVPRRPGDGRFIIAEGEATGHHHAIADEIDFFALQADTDEFMIRNKMDKVTVKHEEHNPIDLPKGDYVTRIVKEFDHEQEHTRNVID